MVIISIRTYFYFCNFRFSVHCTVHSTYYYIPILNTNTLHTIILKLVCVHKLYILHSRLSKGKMSRYWQKQFVSSSSSSEDEDDDDGESSRLTSLDKLYLDILKLESACSSEREKLAELMSQGFHYLAQCRYIMGENKVCSAQLPGSGDMVLAKFKVLSKLHIGTLCYYFIPDVIEYFHCATAETSDEPQDNARAVSKKCAKPGANPLAWFGIIVPGHLKQAQTNFRKALWSCIEIVNLQRRIEYVSQKYREGVRSKERKHKIEPKR
ncbi:hypothetical protein B566_EDAN016027 [Ephemera danica]|nr:hypothetical protein B566_EDAN016027 [Ephemera danica]